MIRILRGELRKIRTTNVWWLIGLATLVTTALAFLLNAIVSHYTLLPPGDPALPADTSPEQAAQIRQDAHDQWVAAHSAVGLARMAANIYTSGQFFGLMFVLLLGVLAMTNEYHHQTATTTFLAVPWRDRVVGGKALAVTLVAAGFWAVTTVLDVIAGAVFFSSEGVSGSLGRWDVTRTLLLNLAAYLLWAVLGMGLGVLIRSQIMAVVIGTVAYVLSLPATVVVFEVIRHFVIKHDWVYKAQVIVPSVASDLMVNPDPTQPHSVPQWVAALVLVGYGLATTAVGTLLTRRRDIGG
jgi:ABC-2 type transport system permease protein